MWKANKNKELAKVEVPQELKDVFTQGQGGWPKMQFKIVESL